MNRNAKVWALLSTMLLLLLTPARAQESEVPAISTERPTVGYSPDLIPRGSLQIEDGVGLSLQRTQYLMDAFESLLRLGLTNRVEIRFLASDGLYQSATAGAPGSLHTADTAFSTKLLLAGPNTLIPKSAVLSVSFPTGGPALTSGTYDPSLAVIWTQSMRRGYFLNEVAGATLTNLYGARRVLWAPSIAGGRAFSDTVGAFAEYAPSWLPDPSLPYVVDGGLAFTRRKRQQFDIRTGFSKDSNGGHTLITFGYSIRFDSFLNGWTRDGTGRWSSRTQLTPP